MRLLLIAALLSFTALGGAHAAAEARLRPNALVIGDQITLGDVIEGAGDAAQVRVARAPKPGERMMLRRSEIAAIASRHGIELGGARSSARVEVTRASRVVSKSIIREALEEALVAEGLDGLFEIQIRNRQAHLEVARYDPATVVVEALDLNKRTGRFSARLAAPAGPDPVARARITGRVIAVIEIPVLRHSVAVGAVIDEDDIDWLQLPSDKVGRNIVVDFGDLLGKSPRRPIRPQRPVRARDVERPQTVEKGALVTMTLVRPQMMITVTGQALESGAEGDLIRVRNSRSHIVVQGVISGPGQVRVAAISRLVTASN